MNNRKEHFGEIEGIAFEALAQAARKPGNNMDRDLSIPEASQIAIAHYRVKGLVGSFPGDCRADSGNLWLRGLSQYNDAYLKQHHIVTQTLDHSRRATSYPEGYLHLRKLQSLRVPCASPCSSLPHGLG